MEDVDILYANIGGGNGLGVNIARANVLSTSRASANVFY